MNYGVRCCARLLTVIGLLNAVLGGSATAMARAPRPLQTVSDSAPCRSLPLQTFAYERSAPLDLRDSIMRVEDGVEVHAVSFASPRGGRATGLLFVPARLVEGGTVPGVVMQHGLPGKAEFVSWVSGNIARHGAIVIALDAPFARRSGPPMEFTPQDSAEQVQLIVDLRRAFDVLERRRDVATARLAFIGRSYGGAMGGLLAGVEHRPRAFVLVVPDGGLVAHYTAAGHGGALDTLSRERRERWLAAMRPIEPIRYIGCAKGASFFFQAARRDESVTPQNAIAYQRAAPQPKRVRWYDLDHNLGWPSIVDELEWLHRTLSTAPPGPKAEMWCATKGRCSEQ
jgi:uncharacterized protein